MRCSLNRTAAGACFKSAARARLALEQGLAQQILAVEVEEIEGEIDEIGRRLPMRLQPGERRLAVRPDGAELAVGIGVEGFEPAGRAGDLGGPGLPTEAA